MANSDNITYTVLIRDKAGWQVQGTSSDMQTALTAGSNLFATGRYLGIKVDKQFYDDTNERFVTTTIMQRAKANRTGLPALIALALFGGLVSFAVTYFVAQKLL